MTNAAWLIALLCPRAVAPHQNFASADIVTPPGLLALTVQGRGYELDNLLVKGGIDLTEPERTIIVQAPKVFGAETRSDAVDRLIELVDRHDVDSGIAVSAALLSAVALSEVDAFRELAEVLKMARRRLLENLYQAVLDPTMVELAAASLKPSDLSPDDLRFLAASSLNLDFSHDHLLLAGALRQQEAMRLAEFGLAYADERDAAHQLLRAADPSRVRPFQLSKGARWGRVATVRKVREFLLDASQDLFDKEVGFPDARTLRGLLKRKQSALAATYLQEAGAGAMAHVKEAFSGFAQSAARTYGIEDSVDAPVWRALTLFELSGHYRYARRHRLLLGQLRMMRIPEGYSDGLRLLRQSGDLKTLNLALNHVRAHGPLAVLEHETRDVLSSRLAPELLRDVELALISAGAQTLDETTARSAMNTILDAAKKSTVARSSQLVSIRIEQLIKALVSLAPVAAQNERLSDWLLTAISDVGPTSDELLARAYGRGISGIDWGGLSEDRLARWRSWLRDAEKITGWDNVVDQISPHFAGSEITTVDPHDPLSLSRVASELNLVIAGGEAPEWLLEVSTPLVADSLARGRSEAAMGKFSFYSTNPADIAAGLCLYLGADLWDELVPYLIDRRLPRSFKVDAINRLVNYPERIPSAARDELGSHAEDLLAPSSFESPFEEPGVDPFAPAVRLLSVTGAWPIERSAVAVARLGAGDARARLEAGRTVTTLMRTIVPIPDWLVFAALQLSSDSDANVRAETGRALAVGGGRAAFAGELMQQRLRELLNEEGILVPLLVLRGLTADAKEIPPGIWDQVAEMARNHLVHGVREQAKYLLADRGGD